jgi:hypothetical protein
MFKRIIAVGALCAAAVFVSASSGEATPLVRIDKQVSPMTTKVHWRERHYWRHRHWGWRAPRYYFSPPLYVYGHPRELYYGPPVNYAYGNGYGADYNFCAWLHRRAVSSGDAYVWEEYNRCCSY